MRSLRNLRFSSKSLKKWSERRGFEPPTPSPPDWCANQAALRSAAPLLPRAATRVNGKACRRLSRSSFSSAFDARRQPRDLGTSPARRPNAAAANSLRRRQSRVTAARSVSAQDCRQIARACPSSAPRVADDAEPRQQRGRCRSPPPWRKPRAAPRPAESAPPPSDGQRPRPHRARRPPPRCARGAAARRARRARARYRRRWCRSRASRSAPAPARATG